MFWTSRRDSSPESFSRLRAVGPGGGQEGGRVGYHVARGASVQAAHGHHHRVEHVEPAGDQGMQRHHHLAGRGDRVRVAVRYRGMSAATADRHVNRVGRGERRAWPGGEHPAPEHVRENMQRVGRHGRLAGRAEHAFLEHDPGPAAAFLGRLEHEDHAAGDLSLPCGQQARRAGQHRRVQVVAARVHHAIDPGGKRRSGRLRHGQRVHVPAQQHHRSRPAAAQHGGHRREFPAQGDVQRQPVQRGEYLLLRPGQVIADLRLLVDGMAQARDLRRDHGRFLTQSHQVLPARRARTGACP